MSNSTIHFQYQISKLPTDLLTSIQGDSMVDTQSGLEMGPDGLLYFGVNGFEDSTVGDAQYTRPELLSDTLYTTHGPRKYGNYSYSS